MSTRSLVGVLDVDGRTYRARYCHSDGYPTHQLPALALALHEHHDGDLSRLATAILEHEWSFIAADEAAAEVADATVRNPYAPTTFSRSPVSATATPTPPPSPAPAPSTRTLAA